MPRPDHPTTTPRSGGRLGASLLALLTVVGALGVTFAVPAGAAPRTHRVLIDTDLGGFQVPVGQPASVSVRLSCTVPLADLIVPGWPGAWQLKAEATSALDRYRRRG